MRTLGTLLLAGSLFAAVQFSFGQQGAVSQSEHDRLESKIRSSIRYHENMVEQNEGELPSWERDLERAVAARAGTLISINKKGLANTKDRIREHKSKIAELETQLRNLPPVRDERAERERQQRASDASLREEQAARAARRPTEIESSSTSRNQTTRDRSQRDAATVNGVGSLLQGFANAWAESKQREPDPEPVRPRTYGESERRVVDIPNVVVPSTRERTRVLGSFENGQFVPTAPTPEPARPLLDMPLADFFKNVSADTGGNLLSEVVSDLKNGESPKVNAPGAARDAAVEAYLESLPAEQQARIRAAYYTGVGDKNAALDAAFDLLPPEKRLDARASQLPAWFLNGSADRMWDKQIVPLMDEITGAKSGGR